MRKHSKYIVVAGALAALAAPSAAMADGTPTCQPTPTGLTAAVIGTPTGTDVNATGCDIGVYNPTTNLSGVKIHDATQYGVYVNNTSANVRGANVSNIGDHPLFDGAQHGVGIYYTNGATGTISGNTVTHYQKNGIVATGTGTAVAVTGNTVSGEGPIGYIAQNGIEFGRGATGSASGNTVTGNEYTGTGGASSGGIIVFGGPGYGPGVAYSTGISISKNTATNNDVGIWLSNAADASGAAPSTPTNNTVENNTISKTDGPTNTSGGTNGGYQAGIADLGNKDNIIANKVGTYVSTTNTHSVAYDLSGSLNYHINHNG